MSMFSGLAVTVIGAAGRFGHGPARVVVVLALLVLVAIVVLVAVFVTRWWRKGPSRRGEGVLAERFARGEIDEGEYRERLTVLRS